MTGHRSALIGIWSAPFIVAGLTAGFLLAGLFPPPPADATAAEATEKLFGDVTALRIGLLITSIAVTGFTFWGASVASQMRRIEGVGAPMARVMLAGSAMLTTMTIMYCFLFLGWVLREGRPEEMTLAVYDLFWVPFVGILMPTMMMGAALAITVFGDRSPTPLFPRWVGWLSAWYAIGSLAGALVPFFTTGPFAWNGGIAFYTAFTEFFVWFFPVTIVARRAILAQLAEAEAA